MRKTRKYPNMMGSIRKHKKDVRQARAFGKWHKSVFENSCALCVSEPICESLIP